MKILCIGDIYASPGRETLRHFLPKLRETHQIDWVIANVENSSGGKGLTWKVYEELTNLKVDAMTGGNHIFAKSELVKDIDKYKRLVRPANFSKKAPGVGYRIFEVADLKIAVVNLIGRVFMQTYDCPFNAIDEILKEIKSEASFIIVDMHAEATSEKQAMGHYLDGQVALVFGTHTHVQTADEKILPKGTAYISDLGMTGSHNSVLGVKKEIILKRFLDQMPVRHESSKALPYELNGILVDIDTKLGKVKFIQRVKEIKND